jgi:hypothetical protein
VSHERRADRVRYTIKWVLEKNNLRLFEGERSDLGRAIIKDMIKRPIIRHPDFYVILHLHLPDPLACPERYSDKRCSDKP